MVALNQQETCACGQPLHYRSAMIEVIMRQLVKELGDDIKVTSPQHGTFWIQRHYLALHGLKVAELPELERKGIAVRTTD
jgi:hypothetical protein